MKRELREGIINDHKEEVASQSYAGTVYETSFRVMLQSAGVDRMSTIERAWWRNWLLVAEEMHLYPKIVLLLILDCSAHIVPRK